MNDEERITHALNGLADIAKRNEAEKEEERKLQKEKEERRKRLYKLYYEQASPISLIIPKDSICTQKEPSRLCTFSNIIRTFAI